MIVKAKSVERKRKLRMRRERRFGLNDSILSNMTVYLYPCLEDSRPLSVEEAALCAAVVKSFNEGNF